MLPPLYTNGRHIVDSNNQRAVLKCVNWYGGHQETRQPGGLHHQPVTNIVQSVVSSQFNCVQLPFSTQMVLEGSMQQFDEVVWTSTTANLMVILNSHTNAASWCCGVNDCNWVWNNQNYSTQDWLNSLEIVTERYRNNSVVVGIDIKNEVHSTLYTLVTWGKSNNPDTDWKAASQLAASVVHTVDADMLIFIQGMCYATEMTDLYKSPPVFLLSSSKLVLVAHVYAWSYWSMLAEEQYNLSSWAPNTLVWSGVFSWLFYKGLTEQTSILHVVLNSMCAWGLLSVITVMFYVNTVQSTGCTAPDSLYISVFPIMGSILAYSAQRRNTQIARLSILCFVCMGVTLFVSIVSVLSGRGMLFTVNVKNSIDTPDRETPLFLGEFGTDQYKGISDSQYLHHVTQYLAQEQLSWAYWALNGDRWSQNDGKYLREDFGLMDKTWTNMSESRLVALNI